MSLEKQISDVAYSGSVVIKHWRKADCIEILRYNDIRCFFIL